MCILLSREGCRFPQCGREAHGDGRGRLVRRASQASCVRPGMASPSAEVQTREAQHARPKAAAGSPRSCVSPDGPRLSTPGRPRRRGHVLEPAAPAGCRAGEARFTKAFGGRPPSERPARAEAHTAAWPGHRALGSGSPAAPAARAGRPFPAEGGADAPAGAREAEVGAHVRGQSRLSRSRGGPRDVAELCSGDGDAAQAATAGAVACPFLPVFLPLFFVRLFFTTLGHRPAALTNAGRLGRALPASELHLRERDACTVHVPCPTPRRG